MAAMNALGDEASLDLCGELAIKAGQLSAAVHELRCRGSTCCSLAEYLP